MPVERPHSHISCRDGAMHRTVLILLLAFCSARACAAHEETLHGFVVGVSSPTTFTIDDYSITRDERLSLDFREINPGNTPNAFKPGDIRVGEEIEIRGDYNPATHQLTVKSVKVLSGDVRQINSTAFPDKLSELQKTPAGWSGYLFVDGMRVHITDSTVVTFRKNKSELEKSKSQDQSAPNPKTASLAALDAIDLNTMAHYEGASQSDGSLLASKVEFEHFVLEPSEINALRKLTSKVQKGNSRISQPDELHVGRSRYKLVPDRDAQDYVRKLGESLVPLHQRELPSDDALKIFFQFYLVEDKDLDVVSFPDGIIVVKSGLFDNLENEAQLAYYMSRAIAQIEERDNWRISRHYLNTNRRIMTDTLIGTGYVFSGLLLGPLVQHAVTHDGYLNSLTDQADRLALEWMLAAGYDIREAPRAYKAYVLRHPDQTPISPTRDANQTEKNDACAARRSFLMAELRTSYSHTNYSSLKKDSDQFHVVARQARQAERGKKMAAGAAADNK